LTYFYKYVTFCNRTSKDEEIQERGCPVHLASVLSQISGIVFCAGFVPYIIAILRRNAAPSKVSWIIWPLCDTIGGVGMYYAHALNSQIVGAIFGAWIVCILALFFGKKGWEKTDVACLATAMLGIVLWKLTASPTWAIIFSQGSVLIAGWPTACNAYREPFKEDLVAWILWTTSCLLELAALTVAHLWSIDAAAQPVTFMIVEGTVLIVLIIRRRTIRNLSVEQS
jgi:hypothetical protein